MKKTISFSSYVRQLCIHVVSSSLVLGALLGIAVLVIGGSTVNANVELDFSSVDSLWLLAGVPVLALSISVLLSPLSFLVHRLLARIAPAGETAGSAGPDERGQSSPDG